MTDESNNGSENLLDQATALLRDSAGTELPPQHLVDQTLMQLAAEEQSRRFIFQRRFPVIKRSWAAAAAITIVCGVALLWATQRSATVAFGGVIEKVRAISAVSFKMKGKVQLPNEPAQDITAQVTIAEPFKMREVVANMTVIMDMAAGKQLMLDPARKTAMALDTGKADNPQTRNMDVLDQFRKFDPKEFKPVGEKVIDNKKVSGFRSENSTQTQTVWVDPATQLPVQMEMKISGGMMPSSDLVMSEFDWNPQIDESTFSLTPPEGYTSQSMSMDVSGLDEKDVIEGLRRLAELNEGMFPDTLDRAGMTQAITKYMQRAAKEQHADADAMKKSALVEMLPVIRGLGFLSKGTDAHYAGKGAKLNEANRPILWYRPKDAQRYQVIDAELKVTESDADHLPQVPSIQIGATTPPS